jgi:hypothetical protein
MEVAAATGLLLFCSTAHLPPAGVGCAKPAIRETQLIRASVDTEKSSNAAATRP